MNLVDKMEQALNDKWGQSQYKWICVKSGGTSGHDGNSVRWSWYCGDDTLDNGKYRYHGISDTLFGALKAMLLCDGDCSIDFDAVDVNPYYLIQIDD